MDASEHHGNQHACRCTQARQTLGSPHPEKRLQHRATPTIASRERICNSLAIDMVVAWRIFFLTMQGREAPELDCTIYFSEHEWKALSTFVQKNKTPPAHPPTLHEAVRLLDKLGGHLGRPGGYPGSEVLWRGMSRLADIREAYIGSTPDFFRAKTSHRLHLSNHLRVKISFKEALFFRRPPPSTRKYSSTKRR